ncbi:MAG: tRNA pseudouridine synthase [Mycobacterium sp.]|nr:tRNA pseudouridine synthase [Mycobacterium sp.]
MSGRAAGPDGLLIVDKATGLTSHDVVARLRRIAATRKVGHAGTLDPDATGVLVCGVGRATRLLGHLLLAEKEYEATVRLGVTTTTDDAEGEVLSIRPADSVTDEAIAAAIRPLTGAIQQVPSAVSAIKVNGVRAYARVRAGEAVELAARPVTVSRFDVLERRSSGGVEELDIAVTCSSGTYIRALARDLGEALNCGAHLTALRRTRVGPFTLGDAQTLEQLAAGGPDHLALMTLDQAVASLFPRRDADAEQAADLRHGRPLPVTGTSGAVGVFGPDGEVLALVEDKDGMARPLVVLNPA